MRTDLAVIFPGQGSQGPHMREVVMRHRPDLLALAVRELGEDPFVTASARTDHVQPAIYCASIAHWDRLGRPPAGVMAGHSLGEVTALAAAGVLDEHDALRLVVLRGRLMQQAADAHPQSGMLAVIGDDRAAVLAIAASEGLTVANDNAPTQVVLSGLTDALDRAAARLRACGMRGVVLPVAGAFHSPLMEGAVAPFAAAVQALALGRPHTPVLCGATARPFEDVARELPASLLAPVRWRETMEAARRGGVASFLEPGPGRALTTLVRRCLPGVEAVAADVAPAQAVAR